MGSTASLTLKACLSSCKLILTWAHSCLLSCQIWIWFWCVVTLRNISHGYSHWLCLRGSWQLAKNCTELLIKLPLWPGTICQHKTPMGESWGGMILAQTAGIAATQTDLLDLATEWARKTEMLFKVSAASHE